MPGDKWVLWHQGRRKWFSSCLSPHSPWLVLLYTDMFALVVTVLTLPLDLSLQATRMSQPFPVSPPPTCLAAGREQDADGSAERWCWAGDKV